STNAVSTHAPLHHCFHTSGHLRDLPSFPTRRSSDLRARAAARLSARCAGGPGGVRPMPAQPLRRFGAAAQPGAAAALGPPASGRSEEHTSELQSRFDLVCRLLLEKKKNRCTATSFAC